VKSLDFENSFANEKASEKELRMDENDKQVDGCNDDSD